jgi:hypothetical protein
LHGITQQRYPREFLKELSSPDCCLDTFQGTKQPPGIIGVKPTFTLTITTSAVQVPQKQLGLDARGYSSQANAHSRVNDK